MKRKAWRNYRLRKDAAAGMTGVALAAKYGISPARVHAILRKYGTIQKVGRPALPPMSDEDRELYVKARRYFGAAYAREQLGIAA